MKKTLFSLGFLASILYITPAFASSCPVTLQKAYKVAGDKAVYYVTENCTKRPFTKAPIFFTYFSSWADVQVISKDTLQSIPNDTLGFMPFGPKYDPKYGAVVKTVNDPKVYFLLGNKKYWIDSEESFNKLHYHWDWVEDVDVRLLDKYQEGSAINWEQGHPNYTLIKHDGDASVYRIEPDPNDPNRKVSRHITSEKVFKDLGYRMDRIVSVPLIPTKLGEWSPDSAVDTINNASLPGDPINVASDAQSIYSDPTPKDSLTRTGFALHNDPYFKFSIEYPKAWKEKVEINEKNWFQAFFFAPGSDIAINRVGKIQVMVTRRDPKDTSVVSPNIQKAVLGDMKAFTLSNFDQPSDPQHFVEVIGSTSDFNYNISYMTTYFDKPENVASDLKFFDQMVASFKNLK